MKRIQLKVEIENKDDVEKVDKDVKNLDSSSEQASSSMKDLAESTGLFGKELTLINRIKKVFNTGMRAMGVTVADTAAGTSRLTKGLRLLRVALVATGIGAIAVAVGTLAAAFMSTQQGVDALNRVLKPLTTGLQGVWGVIQDIATNFTETISSITEGFQRVANIALEVSRGNFRKAWTESKDLISDVAETARNFGSDVVTAYQEGAEAGREIVELEIELEQRRIDSIVPLAEMKAEYQELRTLSGDTALSEEERLEAVEDALVIQDQIKQERAEQLQLEIEILEKKQAQNDTSREEEEELQRLIAQQKELDREFTRQNQNLTRRQSTLINAIEEREEKERQAAEEEAERQRLLAEEKEAQAIIDGENRILREREIQNRLRELDAQNFEEELEVRRERAEIERDERLLEIEREIEDEELRAQEKELVHAEFQANLTEIEDDQAAARKRIAEAETQARIDLANEVGNSLMAITRLAGEQTALGKALGVTSATIDTYVGANKALAQGGIMGPVAAAGVIATGLANVRQILATKVPSIQGQPLGTPANAPTQQPQRLSAPDIGGQGVQTVETVFPERDQNVNVRVGIDEISRVQENVTEIEEGARF